MVPVTNDCAMHVFRANLTKCAHRIIPLILDSIIYDRKLNDALRTLENLQTISPFRYSTVTRTINQCSEDIRSYLQIYSVSAFCISSKRYACRNLHAKNSGNAGDNYSVDGTTSQQWDYGRISDRCDGKEI